MLGHCIPACSQDCLTSIILLQMSGLLAEVWSCASLPGVSDVSSGDGASFLNHVLLSIPTSAGFVAYSGALLLE